MPDKKQPFCWKCSSAVTVLTKSDNSFELDGCTENPDIKCLADAEKLCPLFDHSVKVVIAVVDGEASIVEKPDYVSVEVRDYTTDVEIFAYCEQDEEGDYYRVFSFPATKIEFSANGKQCFTDVEIEQEEPLKSALKHITILQHDIAYYLDENKLLTIEVGDCEYEHILYMITEGHVEGELNKTDPKNDGETIVGWWKIVK